MSSKAIEGLPVLYSRRSDGKIQSWKVHVVGNQFRAVSGIDGGNMVTSEWTTCQGKNEGRKNATSGAAQAEKEARALWKKKCDEGYKQKVEDIDVQTFFSPMLAHVYDDYPDLVKQAFEIKDAVYCQPKLDGMRCIVRPNGMWSRNGKPILSAPHILQALQPLFQLYGPDHIFDGELYADKFADDFNKIISLAKKGKPTAKDLEESAAHLQYHIYDMFCSTSPSVRFATRMFNAQAIMSKHGHPALVMVETVKVDSIETIDRLFGQWRQVGYEGAMIRLPGPYENKRSKTLLKYKQFVDEEFQVLDVLEGVGNRSGMAGMMSFQTAGGRPFTAAIKGNRDFFRKLLEDKDNVIGKMATVEFQNYTPAGSPRFPIVKAIRDYE